MCRSGSIRTSKHLHEARGFSLVELLVVIGIKMSSRFILSGDGSRLSVYPQPYGTNKDHQTFDADLSDEGAQILSFPEDGGFLMHRGGNNVLFDDFHVEVFKHFSSDLMTYHPQQMLSWAALQAAGPDSSNPANPAN